MPNQFRVRRHARMLSLFARHQPLHILDVGGTAAYWQSYGVPDGARVTLLNRAAHSVPHGFISVAGDACDLSCYADGEFDLVFSNSVIEHVGAYERQQAMAQEIRRVGQSYFVQTPARSFPVEPHYRLPFVQFLPVVLQRLVARFGVAMRFYPRYFIANSRDLRLLTAHEMTKLFPDATLWRERIGPLVKSYVAYHLA